MSDERPWEDFAGGATSVATTSKPTQASAGGDTLPWEDFAQASSQGGVRLSSSTPRLDRAAEVFNKAMAYSPFALQESTNDWPTFATALGIRPGAAQGPAAAMQEVTKQGNVLNLATLAALPEAVLTKLPAAVKALIATYFAKTAAEQAGTAAGYISVEGLPKLPVSPMSIDVPIGQALMGQPQAAQDFGGTTEQWRNLGEVVNSLLGVAGAGGVLRGTGRVPSGLEPIDIESRRTLQDLPITTPERPTTQVTGFPWEDFGGQPTTVPPSRQLEAGQPTRFEAPQEGPATKLYSGLNPEDVRPAIKWAGRLFVGEQGDTHQDLRKRWGLPEELQHTRPELGFAHKNATQVEDFLDRRQAEAVTGIKGDAAAGGLDSQQLPGASMHRLERMMKQYDQESQRRIQSGQPQGEESRAVQEQGGSTETPPPGGVLQTSQIGKDIYGQRQQVQLRQPYTEQPVTGQPYPGQLGEAAQSEAGLSPVRRANQRGQAGEERRAAGDVGSAYVQSSNLTPQEKAALRTRQGRGETQYFSGLGISLEDVRNFISKLSPVQLKMGPTADEFLLNLVNRYPDPVTSQEGFNKGLDARPIEEISKYFGSNWRKGLAKYIYYVEKRKAEASQRPSEFYSGVPLSELEKVWDGMKKWFKGPVADTKDWSPLRDPAAMQQEILESKTATPITSKQAGVKLPTEGPDTTLGDRIINSQNEIAKKWAAVRDLGSKIDKLITPFDVFLDMANGGKGTFRNALIRNIRWTTDYDFNVELNQQERLLKPVDQALKENNITRKNGIRTGIYSAVQQGLRDRMIKNGVSATYIDNVVKTFSLAEKRAYDVSQRLYNETFPALQSLAKDLLGIDLQKINNYSPIHSDWRDVKKPPELIKPGGGKEAVEDDLLNFFQGDFRQGGTKTAQGFLEPRLPNAETMMNLDYYDVYKRHMKDVAHFLSSQRRLSELAKIVRDPKFEEKYGDVTQKLVIDWLNNYAKQGRSISAIPGLNGVRKAVAKGVLGFRVSSQLVHLANVPLGLQRAGPGNYARGLQFAMSEAGQEFLHKNLAETFERGGGEIELLEKQGPFAKAAFRPQRELDKWNSQATALGVYLRENGTFDGPVNQKALAIARVETRRAVASPLYKDLPPLLRNQAGKIIGQFQNTFMDQWSNIRYDLPQYLRNDPKKAMGLFVALSGMVLVESGIKYEEKKLRHQLEGYHPKTDLDDTYQKKVAEEALKRLPGYNQAAANLEYGSTGVPLIDMIKEGAKTAKDLYVATRDEDKTGQKLAGLRAATMAAEGLGVVGSGYGGQILQEVVKGKLFKPHSQRVQEVADKAGLDLSDFDQRLASEAYLKETREPMTKEESTRAAIAAEKNQLERWKRVMNSLSKEDRQWLKTNKIEPPGFGDYLEQAKIRVPYTDAENKFATEMYKSEYETVISFLRNDAGFKQLLSNEQQLVANEAFRDAAKRAREQTEEVVKSGALVEKPKKKKRFSAFAPE